MNRRDVAIVLFAFWAALLAAPLPAVAQPAGKMPRLCFLTFDPGLYAIRFKVFFQSLRDLGYVDRQTIAIDYLTVEGDAERFPALAAECVRLRADVIVVTTTPAAQAAKNATSTIPIVMLSLGDPVGTGLVKSLARPGGNVTGLTFMAPGVAAKRLELLKQVMPHISRVLVLTYLTDPIALPQVEEMKKTASSLGVNLLIRDIRTAEDLPVAFRAGAKERAEALLTTQESIFVVHQARVIELADRYRLPGIYVMNTFVELGGLMSYGANIEDLRVRAATYVDRILKGAKPADLPVEQPTRFELTINLKTAKSLGITIPPVVLLRADRVIE